MRWQRPARLALAVIGVGFAVTLFMVKRDGPVSEPEPPPIETDPDALTESGGGRFQRWRDGKLEFTLEHEGQGSYPGGRQRFLQAHIVFADTGQEIWADRLETLGQAINSSQPARLELSGNVRLAEGRELLVEADAATYHEATGQLDVPGDVSFAKGDLRGGGTGATYNREQDLFQIFDHARAEIPPDDAGAGGLDLSARRMSLARAQNDLRLDEGARIARAHETLTGDHATIAFADPDQTIRFVELRGHAAVTPAEAGAQVPAMTANDITMAFHPDDQALQHATLTGQAHLAFHEDAGERSIRASWLDMYLAPDGRTLTRLDGRDQVVVTLPAGGGTPARVIRAPLLVARGTAGAGLQTASFDNGVEFTEQIPAAGGKPASTRSARSQSLALTLDGGLDAITQAEFRGSVTFAAGDLTGEAELARYRAAEGRILLLPGQSTDGRQPQARRNDDSFVVDGDSIDLAVATEDLHAVGNVSTVSRSSGRATDRQTALFEAGKPVYGSAAELRYTAAAGQATYLGRAGRRARLIQEQNLVAAMEIVVGERTNDLRASGGVESTLVEPAQEPDADPLLHEVEAETLVYDDTAGTATYDGAPVTFRSGEAVTTASRLVVRVGAGRLMEGFAASGAVFAVMAGGYEAKGSVLESSRVTGEYTLNGEPGKPAQVKSPNSTGDGCVLSIGPRVVFKPGARADWRSPSAGLVQTKQIDCGVSIR